MNEGSLDKGSLFLSLLSMQSFFKTLSDLRKWLRSVTLRPKRGSYTTEDRASVYCTIKIFKLGFVRQSIYIVAYTSEDTVS